MPKEPPIILEVDGINTLPIYVVTAKMKGPIPKFGIGNIRQIFRDPQYLPPQLPYDNAMLRGIDRDPEIAMSIVKRWGDHSSKFRYFVQFSDEGYIDKCKMLEDHTYLISDICDQKLSFDPTVLWRTFDDIITIQSIHLRYRNEVAPELKWDEYASSLKESEERLSEHYFDTIRFLQRTEKQIERKKGSWHKLPQLIDDPSTQNFDVLNLFYSYSHKDESLRDQLDAHLAMLRRERKITGWHDRCIVPGADWKGEIDENIETARIILLLISSDFIASDYCMDVELERALQKHDEGTARVVPVILRGCDWKNGRFAKLQALPKDAKPVTSWSNIDEAFADVASGIRNVVDELTRG